MINITQVLSGEHQIILSVIDATLKACTEIENGKALNQEYFIKTVDFIKNYADKFHHAKEEDILFTAMLKNQELMHCNPIPVMLHEHDEGRKCVKGMEHALSENAVDELIEYARAYCMLLENHIYKEDNVLYPMAEAALSDKEKEEVNRKYQEVELKLNEEMNLSALSSF